MIDDEIPDGLVPISVKPTSRLASQLLPSAHNLGSDLSITGELSGHRIRNGFLIRAIRLPILTNVHIIDPPALLLMGGTCAYAAATRYVVNNALVPVGNRDDFSPPGYRGTGRSLASATWLQLTSPGLPPATDVKETLLTYCHAQPVVDGFYVVTGHMRIPTNLSSLTYINDHSLTEFTNANTVRVGCGYRIPRLAIGAVDGDLTGNQLSSLNSFWVSESDLPSGWRFLPRRLADSYVNGNYVQQVINWYAWTPGVNVVRASGAKGDTTDRFLIAVQAVKQLQTTWTSSSGTYYDPQGERCLMLLAGTLEQPATTPSEQLYADLAETTLILPTSIDQDGLHPMPATYQVTTDGPVLTTYAYFLQPQVQRCDDGLVTFCTYQAPYTNTSDDKQITTGALTLYAVLVVTPAGECLAPKGDIWANGIYAFDGTGLLPSIADTNTTYSTIPWIVGSDSVLTTDDQGTESRTAYALVWEEHRSRSQTTQSGSTDGNTQYQGSWTMGGVWALYSFKTGSPVRAVMADSDVTPLFTPMMGWDKFFPFSMIKAYESQAQEDNQANLHTTFSSMYHLGDGTFVTAAILASVTLENQIWFTTADTGGFIGHLNIVTHDVYCAVVDPVAGTVTKRGVICQRSDTWYYCHITIAQPAVAATATAEAKPAALLASVYSTAPNNSGVETSVPDQTTIYVSVDGGDTWKLYASDMAAPNGAFLIGNQLWTNDVTSRYDEGLAG